MKVQDVMTRDVKCCTPDDSLEVAARILWENDCGCLPVVGDGRVVAMLTDRDICMAAYTQGRCLCDIRVASAMSHELETAAPGDALARAERVMQERQLRRLPVVDTEGQLVGLLSLSDIARAARGSSQGSELRDVAMTLAVIGQPRNGATTTVQRTPKVKTTAG